MLLGIKVLLAIKGKTQDYVPKYRLCLKRGIGCSGVFTAPVDPRFFLRKLVLGFYYRDSYSHVKVKKIPISFPRDVVQQELCYRHMLRNVLLVNVIYTV